VRGQRRAGGAGGAGEAIRAETVARMWRLSDTMGAYVPSASLDFLAGRPVEVDHLLRRPLERAKKLGVEVPHTEDMVRQVEELLRERDLKYR